MSRFGLLLVGLAFCACSAHSEPVITTCTSIDDVRIANEVVVDHPDFIKVSDSDLALLKTAYTSQGWPWPDVIKVVWLGKTRSYPELVFVFAFDANGCFFARSQFNAAMIDKIFGVID